MILIYYLIGLKQILANELFEYHINYLFSMHKELLLLLLFYKDLLNTLYLINHDVFVGGVAKSEKEALLRIGSASERFCLLL